MSFFKKLFGGGSSDAAGVAAAESVEHEGYTITPSPRKEGGQFRLMGTVTKEVDGEILSHTLIRADVFPSVDECNEACIRKAKQVIKEQGDNLFR